MSGSTYVRLEVLRTFRNVRFFVFSLVFPVILYVVVVGGNRNVKDFAGTGLAFSLYYMVGMVSWGAMAAVIAGGARIALERSIGWVRKLRLTPLRVPTYFGAKVLSGYGMAAVSIVLLYGVGIAFGVRLPLSSWGRMTLLILIGLIPFAALGIWLGHVLSVDSMGPVIGGITALFALLGGAWGPIAGDNTFVQDLAELIPSYWLVQAAHSAFTGQWWPAKGWIVVGVWTLVLVRLARRAYLRDTLRV
ncbi:MAG: ABC transporter permease [Actinomycetes bacterium]